MPEIQTLTEKQKLIYENISNIYTVMPFNKHLGITVLDLTENSAKISINMADELIGNMAQGILHGGVTSSILDVVGGIAVTSAILNSFESDDINEMFKRISKLGTINMQVDFLKPGWGEVFTATSELVRLGNRVAVTRMEVRNQDDVLIAMATASYSVA